MAHTPIHTASLAVFIAGLIFIAAPGAQVLDPVQQWAQWRGPNANGVSPAADPPLEWSETKNIRWKVEIPGRGSSSPVIWGDKLFLLSAVPVGVQGDAQHTPRGGLPARGTHRFMVMALDRTTGRTIWERQAREAEPHEAGHFLNSTWASGSAVTDGQRVFAHFESFGLYAYDMDGKLLWEKDLGDKRMRNQFGEGSTPALHGNTLVAVWDHLNGQSFIVALDARDGKELWRIPRMEIDTWATPLILEVNGRPQVIVPALNRVRSYDLANGNVVWESDGLTMNAIPSPIVSDGILYFLKSNSGILSAFDAKTGKPHYQNQRLGGLPNVFSSPVAARGRVYFTGREGKTLVIRAAPAFDVLATNTLDDGFDASPALIGNNIYLRGYKYLYNIAAQ